MLHIPNNLTGIAKRVVRDILVYMETIRTASFNYAVNKLSDLNKQAALEAAKEIRHIIKKLPRNETGVAWFSDGSYMSSPLINDIMNEVNNTLLNLEIESFADQVPYMVIVSEKEKPKKVETKANKKSMDTLFIHLFSKNTIVGYIQPNPKLSKLIATMANGLTDNSKFYKLIICEIEYSIIIDESERLVLIAENSRWHEFDRVRYYHFMNYQGLRPIDEITNICNKYFRTTLFSDHLSKAVDKIEYTIKQM